MKIKALLTYAIARLNSDEAAIEAQLLLQHTLKVNRAWLIAHQNDALEANLHEAYRALLNRRLNGEPIAYILGCREFYGLNLKVTPDTLIPRADTETLVEAALAKIALPLTPSPQPSPTEGEGVTKLSDSATSPRPLWERVGERGGKNITILDLGTGTGAIALAIAKHRPQAHVTALDASQAALDIAIENAQYLNILNVKFIFSDWFSALNTEKFDVIVSNPPYIEAADAHLKQGDLCFEPISALASGEDGLDDIRAIISQAPQHLNPYGWLMLEHGYNQAESVATLLKQAGFSEIDHVKDLAGINRVTLGQLN